MTDQARDTLARVIWESLRERVQPPWERLDPESQEFYRRMADAILASPDALAAIRALPVEDAEPWTDPEPWTNDYGWRGVSPVAPYDRHKPRTREQFEEDQQ